jgi:hypothetical protein
MTATGEAFGYGGSIEREGLDRHLGVDVNDEESLAVGQLDGSTRDDGSSDWSCAGRQAEEEEGKSHPPHRAQASGAAIESSAISPRGSGTRSHHVPILPGCATEDRRKILLS